MDSERQKGKRERICRAGSAPDTRRRRKGRAVSKGNGTDGNWHGNSLTPRDSRLSLIFWGSGRAEQANAQRPSPGERFPFPPPLRVSGWIPPEGKRSRSQDEFALLLITSASSPPSPEATGTIPRENPSGRRAKPRLLERENRRMLALERLSVESHGSWTCCLPDPFTPLPDI